MSGAKQPAALARWRKIREQGPLRFIVYRGMRGWGLTTSVLWCGLMGCSPTGSACRC